MIAVLLHNLHIQVFLRQPFYCFFRSLLHDFPEFGVISHSNQPEHLFQGRIVSIAVVIHISNLFLQALGIGVKFPIDRLHIHFVVESFIVDGHVVLDPKFLQHGNQLLSDVDVIIQSQFDLLFPLQDFLVLVLEKNRTKTVDFGYE